MSTNIRPEISKRSKNWISRERYYELMHFCKQYGEWKKAAKEIEAFAYQTPSAGDKVMTSDISDQAARYTMARDYYLQRMRMVEKACEDAAGDLAPYIFETVTTGATYEHHRMTKNIPCCRDVFYAAYRKFFWLLSQSRN